MTKQVPEEKKASTLSSEEQIHHLLNKLIGNEAFATCRGRFGHRIGETVADMIKIGQTPTRVLALWDQFIPSARVMTNMLSVLKRDGMTSAYNELLLALNNEDYVMTGEIVPVEKTEPITLVMLDPRRTMTMLKWIMEGHWVDLDNYLDWKDQTGIHSPSKKSGDQPSDLTRSLFKLFPTLEKHTRKRRERREYEGWDLQEAYADAVVRKLSKKIRKALGGTQHFRLARGNDQYNDHLEIGDIAFLFAFKGGQASTLKLFSRKQQEKIATWYIEAPRLSEDLTRRNIGIHPEVLHESIKKMRPSLTSKGVSHSLGAVVLHPLPSMTVSDPRYYPQLEGFSIEQKTPYGIIFQN